MVFDEVFVPPNGCVGLPRQRVFFLNHAVLFTAQIIWWKAKGAAEEPLREQTLRTTVPPAARVTRAPPLREGFGPWIARPRRPKEAAGLLVPEPVQRLSHQNHEWRTCHNFYDLFFRAILVIL